MGRVIAIGDIHGQLRHLNNLLDKLELQTEDKIIFLGDYIDRGPSTPEVVEKIRELPQEKVFLRGNHEQMLLDAIDYPESHFHSELWINNGGMNTHYSYDRHPTSLWTDHIGFFRATEMTHKEEIDGIDFYFSHAGWSEHNSLSEQYESIDTEIVLWTRSHLSNPETAMLNWTDGVAVFGHTPLEKPFLKPPMIGIDTGATFGRVLTAAILGQQIKVVQSGGL